MKERQVLDELEPRNAHQRLPPRPKHKVTEEGSLSHGRLYHESPQDLASSHRSPVKRKKNPLVPTSPFSCKQGPKSRKKPLHSNPARTE